MEIGELIRRLRAEQAVSQTSLARRAGTSQAAISDIERGQVSPSVETIERLLLCLGHRLRVDAEPLPMDSDIESLREMQALAPRERLHRMSKVASFVRRGQQAVLDQTDLEP